MCMYVCMYVCVYVCVGVCMYVCVCGVCMCKGNTKCIYDSSIFKRFPCATHPIFQYNKIRTRFHAFVATLSVMLVMGLFA